MAIVVIMISLVLIFPEKSYLAALRMGSSDGVYFYGPRLYHFEYIGFKSSR